MGRLYDAFLKLPLLPWPPEADVDNISPPTTKSCHQDPSELLNPLHRTGNANSIVYDQVTRSHKFNDRDHSGDADQQQEHLPKYFAKSGFVDTDPKKTKKDGGGRGNWGREGEEIEDYSYNLSKPRRRSNSSSQVKGANAFKTKFETIEPEPVFEMSEHGPLDDDDAEDAEHSQLEHRSTTSTDSSGQSPDEEQA